MSQPSIPHIRWTGTLQTTGPSTPPTLENSTGLNFNGSTTFQLARFPDIANIQAGDLLIIAVAGYGGGVNVGAKSIQTGDDWNELYDEEETSGDNGRLNIYWRYAKARDKGGVTINASTSNEHTTIAFVIAGVASSNPISASGVTKTAASASHVSSSETVTKNSMSLIIANLFDAEVGTTGIDGSLTDTVTATGTSSGLDRCVLRAGYKTNSADGSSGTFTFTSASNDNSIMVNLTIDGGFRSTYLAHSVDPNWADVIYMFEPNHEDLVDNEYLPDIAGNTPNVVIDTASNNLYNFLSRQNGGSIRGNGSRWYKGDNTNGEFTIPTGEFCIEWWYYVAAANQSNAIWGLYNVTGNHRSYYFYTNVGQLGFYFSKNGTDFFGPIITSTQPSAGAWHHICLERDVSDLITLYVDGTSVDSLTDGDAWNNPAGNADFMIGGRNNGGQLMSNDVYVGAIRATAAARYNGNFTVPDDVWPRG